MNDKALKEHLAGLFTGLKYFYTDGASAAKVDEKRPESVSSLEKLFSDTPGDVPENLPADLPKSTHATKRPTSAAIADVKLQPKPASEPEKSPAPPQPDHIPATRRNGQVTVDETTPPATEERLLQLLKSKDAGNRCQAVEYLAKVQNPWVIDHLLQAITDKHSEVAGLALAALLQVNDMVKQRLPKLAKETLILPRHRGSEVYLSYLLGQPFIYIPFGPFMMGSHPAVDELTDENEQPQHTIRLPGYWMARYPVTVAQFQAFARKTGHKPGGDGYRNQPDNYPAVDMTWPDALAYCHWLSQHSGLSVTLPSEAEWEKAARGTDGRRYPWGDGQPTETLCNFQQATPVGHYSPQGDSPYGCADMAGNVWEWTRSIYQPYPYNARDGRESLEGNQVRTIRGLTFNNAERFTRCAFRYKLAPSLHLRHLGFRVVVSPDYL